MGKLVAHKDDQAAVRVAEGERIDVYVAFGHLRTEIPYEGRIKQQQQQLIFLDV